MIRRMEPKDLEQVAQIEKICFTESWSFRLLEAGLASPYDVFYVFEQEERIFGYCCLRILAGEGEIQRLAVLPPFRQKGLGRGILVKMGEGLREKGVGAITLEVRESNIPARKLYISAGFQEEARRKDYYRNPKEDGIIMWNRGRP